jgi:hypothetical protein
MYAYISDVDYFRYGPRAHGEEVMSMYGNSRAQGLAVLDGSSFIQLLTMNYMILK